jgi:hypothetical protein
MLPGEQHQIAEPWGQRRRLMPLRSPYTGASIKQYYRRRQGPAIS